jgi:hypothetical protein
MMAIRPITAATVRVRRETWEIKAFSALSEAWNLGSGPERLGNQPLLFGLQGDGHEQPCFLHCHRTPRDGSSQGSVYRLGL